jgi:hypothetical protein
MARRKGHRVRRKYQFWLDLVREDDYDLNIFIEVQRNRRTFTQTVRDGLLLMQAIGSSDPTRVMDALDAIAPWFVTWLNDDVAQRLHAQRDGDTDDLRRQLEYLRGRIDALGQGTHAAPGLQPLAPRADDDEDDAALLTVKKAKVDNAQITRNFINSMNALQGARYIELTEQRTQNSAFTFGWFAQRVAL